VQAQRRAEQDSRAGGKPDDRRLPGRDYAIHGMWSESLRAQCGGAVPTDDERSI
jgi:hypothetical protein